MISRAISQDLGLAPKSVKAVLQLLGDGSTIPFIARYRKEATGGLDEVQIGEISIAQKRWDELEKRKSYILETIESQGKLDSQLAEKIQNVSDLTTLEDIYLPFKKKRKTRAKAARDLGLEPLANQILHQKENSPMYLAKSFLTKEVPTVEKALEGAHDIIAENISELDWVRQKFREDYKKYGRIKSKPIKAKMAEGRKYSDYFEVDELLHRCPSHRLLAINRAESEGFIKTSIEIDYERSVYPLKKRLIRSGKNPAFHFLNEVFDDAFKRLIKPSIENEILAFFKEKADLAAIETFDKNLEQLLLAPPLGQKMVLAIDPGFRTGCKVVVLDQQGSIRTHTNIYPHPPQNRRKESLDKIVQLIHQYDIDAIAVGNGTASRETMQLLNDLPDRTTTEVYLVSESGASIYSASELARNEFPDLDVTVRGAISIGRRLMDPLSELIKIDPKSIGVGQYQHDVDQKKLQEKLDLTVERCVNKVGVQLNTASKELLQYIAGIGPALADSIIKHREAQGLFKNRRELLHVPRLGEKAFEQAAGFLRLRGSNNPLDNTAVHPESYHIVESMARDLRCNVEELLNNPSIREDISLERYQSERVGMPTLTDIMKELEKPGLDPRGQASVFSFRQDIVVLKDLHRGMVLPGLVTNLTDFGAFVDVGIKENGLIHKSQMGEHRNIHPSNVLSLQQEVEVEVLEIDFDRKRLQLKLVRS